MKIALIGYGKMGKEIEKFASARGHEVVLKVDEKKAETLTAAELRLADVAVEFSVPESAVNNIYKCFEAGIPIVVGTTGWLNRLDEVRERCKAGGHAMFYASNYSIGVNLFFRLNEHLARLMNPYPDYDVSMEEIHHVHKLDSPSGTAITLACQVIDHFEGKQQWVNEKSSDRKTLGIISKRIDEVPGTHTVTYSSEVDEISITHKAHNRKGFALGAVIAAEWMIGKKGVFGMSDLMAI